MVCRVNVDWFLNCLIVLVSSVHLDKECRSKGVGVALDELIARLYPEAQAVFVFREDEGSRAYQWYIWAISLCWILAF